MAIPQGLPRQGVETASPGASRGALAWSIAPRFRKDERDGHIKAREGRYG